MIYMAGMTYFPRVGRGMLSPTEFGDQKVPDSIITCVLTLHKEIFKKVKLTEPILRAYALHYFKVTYKENKDDEYFLIYRAIAALHLASKVCEDGKMLEILVKALEECRGKDSLTEVFALLGEIHRINTDFVKTVTESCRLAELDIIQDLQFSFKVVLPYDYMENYIYNVVHWHLPPSTMSYQNIISATKQNCYKFLNDLQLTPTFYNFTPPTVALAAVSLSFYMEHLNVPDFNGKPWAQILEPTVDMKQLNTCIDQIKDFFKRKGLVIENLFHKIDREDALSEWYICPVEDHRSEEPRCSPPDQENMLAFRCTEDAFSNIWSDHRPPIPPPTPDDYLDAIGIAIDEYMNGNLLISDPKQEENAEKKPNHKQDNGERRPYGYYRRRNYQDRRPYPPMRREMPRSESRSEVIDRRSPSIERRPDMYDRRPPDMYDRRPMDRRDDYYVRKPPPVDYIRYEDAAKRPDRYERRDDFERYERRDDYDRRPPPRMDPYDSRRPEYDRRPDSRGYMPDKPRSTDYDRRPEPRNVDGYDRRPESRGYMPDKPRNADYDRRPEPRNMNGYDRRPESRGYMPEKPRNPDYDRRPEPRNIDGYERRDQRPPDFDRRGDRSFNNFPPHNQKKVGQRR